MDLSTVSKTDLQAKLERARSIAKAARVQGARVMQQSVQSAMIVAGGGLAGVLDAKMPTLGSTGVKTSLALGGALVAAALFELAGEYSDEMAALGAGMLAVDAAERAKAAVT